MGLGLFKPLTAGALSTIEAFFLDRGAVAVHEVSPLAGVATLHLLCDRGYRPVEISSVLQRPVELDAAAGDAAIVVRLTAQKDKALWVDLSARGWAQDNPELLAFLRGFGEVAFGRECSVNFTAELEGKPAATASLCLHDGVALFAGASTIPESRRRGLQRALLQARMRYALQHGYQLAMMVTEAGSQSQRNAERQGFRIAYTRTKWQLRG